MKISVVVLMALTMAGPVALADYRPQNRDELNISRVLDRVSAAWRAGDRSSWAAEFVDDAYFTVSFELGAQGREQVAWDHQLIFDNFYTDTSFDIEIRRILFVKRDVVLVQLNGFVSKVEDDSPAAISTAVLERIGEHWKVTAFQDTPFVVDEYRAHGDLRRFKIVSAENAQRSE